MERSGAHNQLGARGEALAAEFLERKGFRILERNLASRIGEIDLLARDGDTLVIVEVKTQSGAGTFNPVHKLDFAKRRKLGLLAAQVAARHPGLNVRVDAVTIYWKRNSDRPVITHLASILS